MIDKYRGGCSQPTIELSTMDELEKRPKELKGLLCHRKNNMNHPAPPELPGSKPSTIEYTGMDP